MYKIHDQTRGKQALRLAQETRSALHLERQLALQRVREAEVLLDILRADARLSDVRVEEADLRVGAARAHLKSTTGTGAVLDDDLPSPKRSPLNSTKSSDKSDSESSDNFETGQWAC